MLVSAPQAKIRNGVSYVECFSLPNTEHVASATINQTDKLFYKDALVTGEIMTGSWKYPDGEFQLVAYSTRPPTLEHRVDKKHKYHRLEFYLDLSHETAEALRRSADLIDYAIEYTKPLVTYSKPKKIFNEKSNLAELLL